MLLGYRLWARWRLDLGWQAVRDGLTAGGTRRGGSLPEARAGAGSKLILCQNMREGFLDSPKDPAWSMASRSGWRRRRRWHRYYSKPGSDPTDDYAHGSGGKWTGPHSGAWRRCGRGRGGLGCLESGKKIMPKRCLMKWRYQQRPSEARRWCSRCLWVS